MNEIVVVRDLWHSWADGREALRGISFTVRDGENIALVGPNGAGKSTLFLLMCGILPIRRGEVRLAELNPAKSADKKKLPSVVGLVFQNPDDQIFSSTVADDVAFGPLNLGLSEEQVRERIQQALQQTGMAGTEERVPYQLSGGEKRRVALAGVLAMRPEILLLDEPTLSLDPRGRRELIRLIRELPGTKIIATHEPEVIRGCCSRVLVINEGRIVAEGSPNEDWENHSVFG